MRKRGQGALELPMKFIWSVLLVAIVGAAAFTMLNGIRDEVTTPRIYGAADLGMTLDAMLGASGTLESVFDMVHISDFDYTFMQGKVAIDHEAAIRVENIYAGNLNYVFADRTLEEKNGIDEVLTFRQPEKLHIIKSGNRIVISEEPMQGLTGYRHCRQAALPSVNRVLLDASADIVAGFRAKYPSSRGEVGVVKPQVQPDERSLYVRVEPRAMPAVWVDVANEDYASSYYLACRVANALVEDGTSVPILPLDQRVMPRYGLSESRVGIVVGVSVFNQRMGERIAEGVAAWA